MIEPEQFDLLLAHLKTLVKAEIKKESRLWDLGDMAEYFKVSKGTVSRYRLQPDFPTSIAIPYQSNGVERMTQRYVPEEIKRWGLRQRGS